MKERPILFSAPMVLALLDGRKTQTRRVISRSNSYRNGSAAQADHWAELDFGSSLIFVDDGPSPAGNPGPYLHVPGRDGDCVHRIYPRWQPEDRLWVKETTVDVESHGYRGPVYAASDDGANVREWGLGPADDVTEVEPHDIRLRPSIFMPRKDSRITLEVTGVRVERLQSIGDADAIAEGAQFTDFGKDRFGRQQPGWRCDGPAAGPEHALGTARFAYGNLWNAINGIGGWDANPWVWVLEFRRVLP